MEVLVKIRFSFDFFKLVNWMGIYDCYYFFILCRIFLYGVVVESLWKVLFFLEKFMMMGVVLLFEGI